jgi:Ring finger domain
MACLMGSFFLMYHSLNPNFSTFTHTQNRPMAYWLTVGRVPLHRPQARMSNTLTEEQFNTLPEIEYKSLTEGDDGPKEDDDEVIVESDPEVGENVAKEMQNPTVDVAARTDMSKAVDVEQPLPPKSAATIDSQETGKTGSNETAATTTCSTCSICIDDFEPGERLTLLPKCQHAFHKDCILPWLTERQGSCPLCKTNVLDDSEAQGDCENESEPSVERESESPVQEVADLIGRPIHQVLAFCYHTGPSRCSEFIIFVDSLRQLRFSPCSF